MVLQVALSLLIVLVGLLTDSYLVIAIGLVTLVSAKFEIFTRVIDALKSRVSAKVFILIEWMFSITISILVIQHIFLLFFEFYTIPSVSMAPNLERGDVVVVSKSILGVRLFESSSSISMRVGGFGSLRRGDIIAFNYPEGDSCYIDNKQDNYLYIRRLRGSEYDKGKRLVFREITQRARYLKRIVALPGDTISLRLGELHVNGSVLNQPARRMRRYELDSVRDVSIINNLKDYPISYSDGKALVDLPYPFNWTFVGVDSVISPLMLHAELPDKLVFPFVTEIYHFNADNIGSIVVPQKGRVVDVNSYTLPFYRRLISVYEGNKLVELDGKIYINGKICTQYTIKQNYYWVMGDNRSHSFDSRYWGFVPENHIVGVASYLLRSGASAAVRSSSEFSYIQSLR